MCMPHAHGRIDMDMRMPLPIFALLYVAIRNGPPVVHVPQLWIRPEELRKTPLPFKKNSSFKNHSKYRHRSTAKKREPC